MENSTPTKIVSRVALSPNSKDSTCIIRLEVILNSDYKRRLFSSSKDGTDKRALTWKLLLAKSSQLRVVRQKLFAVSAIEKTKNN